MPRTSAGIHLGQDGVVTASVQNEGAMTFWRSRRNMRQPEVEPQCGVACTPSLQAGETLFGGNYANQHARGETTWWLLANWGRFSPSPSRSRSDTRTSLLTASVFAGCPAFQLGMTFLEVQEWNALNQGFRWTTAHCSGGSEFCLRRFDQAVLEGQALRACLQLKDEGWELIC